MMETVEKTEKNIIEPYYRKILLWIKDCVAIPQHSSEEEAFIFGDIVVKCVEFIGVVAGVHKLKESFARYIVDDGTGAIMVMFCHSRESNEEKHKTCFDLKSELSTLPVFTTFEHKLLEKMMNDMTEVYEEDKNFRKLGDSVHVIGKLYEYKEERHVKAYQLRVIDMDEEAEIICEIDKHYRDVYDKQQRLRLTVSGDQLGNPNKKQ